MRIAFSFVWLLLLLAPEPGAHPSIRIDLAERHQTIEGLGGFGAASVWWNPGPYFDAAFLDRIVDELGTSMLRTQLYWDFEPANDDADPNHAELSRFRLDPSTLNGRQLEYMKALAARGVKQIASVWTPPIWMKRDPDDKLAVFCEGQCGGRLDPSLHAEYAEYLLTFVQSLQREIGVELYGLSIANEPLFANKFESCVYGQAEYAAVLHAVATRFRAAGLRTKFFGPEHMGSFDWNREFFASLLDDPVARRDLDVYAVHGYEDGVAPDYGSAAGWQQLARRVHARKKPLWMTEISGFGAGFDQAFDLARMLHLALRIGEVSAFVYFYYAGEILDAKGRPSALYYALKHYYKFIRPGAVQVGSNASDPALLVSAFKNADTLTVVVINNGSTRKHAALRIAGGKIPPLLRGYRTSRTETWKTLAHSNARSIAFPPQSITTLIATEIEL